MDQAVEAMIGELLAGRPDAAADAARQILADTPCQPDALHVLARLSCDRGHPAEALMQIEAAIDCAPHRAVFHNTRGLVLVALNRLDEADAAYRTGLGLRPDIAEIANNLACLLRDRGVLDAALIWFEQAASLAPQSADIAVNLAAALASGGAHAASLRQFQRALRLRPNDPDIHYRMGHALLGAGAWVAAEAQFRAALAGRPDHAPSLVNLGVALDRQGRGGAAAQCFRDALHCDPHDADAHYDLGCLLLLDNRALEARACHERAVALDPGHGRALWARCMAELPPLYDSEPEIAVQRARYAAALTELERLALHAPTRLALAAAIGCSQPFFLPYQGFCDRELQARYGALLTRLAAPAEPPKLAAPPEAGAPIRIGIVTGHACEHTLWRLMIKGWLTHLDRQRFSVHVYHTGATHDAQTAIAESLADGFHGGPGLDHRAAILSDRPHVLIYPELGMDPVCARLAAQRLAPVQCVAWGHPQTSGLPSIDWFLSSAAMEPPTGGLHYTEGVVCLPNLGVAPMLQTEPPAACTRADFGLRADATVFWCGQALYKYAPQHDAVFARIAARVPGCQFLFIAFARSAVATAQFQARLARCFAAHGLDAAAHCVVAPSMDQAHFHASVRLADIVLDSIGWSGGKSTLDMLGDGPVIVAHEGGLMRGRHTAGILRCMGLTETIAATVESYIDIAVELAAHPSRRAALQSRLAGARNWLLQDVSPVRALELFLVKAVRSLAVV